ncbi:hypothetical protein JCM11491_000689, partial [Sporobolomyces phaffii]
MHRYYRTRSIDEHGEGYCPLDLYSRDPVRIRKAVDALVSLWHDSRGDANNFRIFVEGERLLPDDTQAIASTLPLLSALVSPSASRDRGLRSLVADSLVPVLRDSPVLSTLSRLQSSLDRVDIEGL